MFLVHRRRTKFSWSGSARHPEKFRHVEISAFWLSTLNRPPYEISAAPDGLANASRPHSKLRPRSPLSVGFSEPFDPFAGFERLKSQSCTCVHSHAAGQKSSGAFFRVMGGERCRKSAEGRRNALRASAGVRPRDVMFNKSGSADAKKPPCRRLFHNKGQMTDLCVFAIM